MPSRGRSTEILTLGFGTTVAMWAVGYVSRIPPAVVPSWALLFLLLACQFGGGHVAGRWTGGGWKAGLLTGLISSLLNLLILGSLLSGDAPNQLHPAAIWWIPGSLAAGTGLAALGALTAGARPVVTRDWTHLFTRVAAGATFFLLIVGGLVTSQRAGLAVVDWPNSYGYSMFLYPLARMTGGIYYEHAHRLFGSLVGLTMIALTLILHRTEERRWIRRLVLVALATVIVQGMLGGLRVTGHFTMSQSPDDTAPNILLAVAHGVLGQVFFALVIALVVFTSPRYRGAAAALPSPYAGTDRSLSAILLAVLILQLILGAVQRHLSGGLIIHITLASGIFLLALAVGIRGFGLYKEVASGTIRRLGKLLIAFVSVQILLGIGALIARSADGAAEMPSAASVLVRTTHQAVGAALLAVTVMLVLWLRRSVVPQPGNTNGDS